MEKLTVEQPNYSNYQPQLAAYLFTNLLKMFLKWSEEGKLLLLCKYYFYRVIIKKIINFLANQMLIVLLIKNQFM